MKSEQKLFDKTLLCAVLSMLVIADLSAQELLAQQAQAPLKVMSFNIRYGSANDGDNHWDKRYPLVTESMRIFDPDLLGLQEALPFQCDYLREQFPQYEFFGRGREADPDKGEFSAILFRRDRFEKTDGGHFWLSETPDQPGSRSWDSSLPRMVTWVQLKDRLTDLEFIYANTHYDHRGEQARLQSSKVIRDWMIDHHRDTPIVITGDFNAAVGSQPYNELTKTGTDLPRRLTDSYRAIYPDVHPDEGSFGGWTGKRDGARIDWILHSQEFTTLNATINYHNDQGRFPSDHYPVQAVIRYKE